MNTEQVIAVVKEWVDAEASRMTWRIAAKPAAAQPLADDVVAAARRIVDIHPQIAA